MTGSALREQVSGALGPWLPAFFESPVPPEERATCADCAMCESAERGTVSGPRALFNPDTKCCTYQPALPNFLVGALLEDRRADMEEGRRRMRERIAQQHGVTPHGVQAPPSYWLEYDAAPGAFGQSAALLCPFYAAGACTIWHFRNGACSTYFCKYERGADGQAFYRALRDYLAELSSALALHAMLDLGADPARALGEATPRVTAEELDGRPLPAWAYAARWGRYSQREETFFREAHACVRALTPEDAAAVGGARLRALLLRLTRAYERAEGSSIPVRLRRNPRLRTERDGQGRYLVEGYSSTDPSSLSERLYRMLDAFDGRPGQEVIEDLRAAGQVFPSEALLRSLHHHRVLVGTEDDGESPPDEASTAHRRA